jgi:hypothetical protein
MVSNANADMTGKNTLITIPPFLINIPFLKQIYGKLLIVFSTQANRNMWKLSVAMTFNI